MKLYHCNECGSVIEDDDIIYCPKCGTADIVPKKRTIGQGMEYLNYGGREYIKFNGHFYESSNGNRYPKKGVSSDSNGGIFAVGITAACLLYVLSNYFIYHQIDYYGIGIGVLFAIISIILVKNNHS